MNAEITPDLAIGFCSKGKTKNLDVTKVWLYSLSEGGFLDDFLSLRFAVETFLGRQVG